MKKLTSMILAVILVMALACTAMADEIPEPEGGKKFNSNWAIQNAVNESYYEEEDLFRYYCFGFGFRGSHSRDGGYRTAERGEERS